MDIELYLGPQERSRPGAYATIREVLNAVDYRGIPDLPGGHGEADMVVRALSPAQAQEAVTRLNALPGYCAKIVPEVSAPVPALALELSD